MKAVPFENLDSNREADTEATPVTESNPSTYFVVLDRRFHLYSCECLYHQVGIAKVGISSLHRGLFQLPKQISRNRYIPNADRLFLYRETSCEILVSSTYHIPR